MQDKELFIIIRDAEGKREKVQVSKKEFDDYYRDVNAFRRKQQRNKLCWCKKPNWLKCDMDCVMCRFSINGIDSLDAEIESKIGNTFTTYDTQSSDEQSVEEIVVNREYYKTILDHLQEICPEAITYGELREQGYKDEAIAKIIGIPRKTLLYRIAKARKSLENYYDFF